jgi:hypothetical protein
VYLGTAIIGKLEEIIVAAVSAGDRNCRHAVKGMPEANFALKLFCKEALVRRDYRWRTSHRAMWKSFGLIAAVGAQS